MKTSFIQTLNHREHNITTDFYFWTRNLHFAYFYMIVFTVSMTVKITAVLPMGV